MAEVRRGLAYRKALESGGQAEPPDAAETTSPTRQTASTLPTRQTASKLPKPSFRDWKREKEYIGATVAQVAEATETTAAASPEESFRIRTEVMAKRRIDYGIKNADEIAEWCGLSVMAVRRVLNGGQPSPNLRTLAAICQALDLTLDEVVDLKTSGQL